MRGLINIWKDVIVSPRAYFVSMKLDEGFKKPFLFALIGLWIRNLLLAIQGYFKGYYFHPNLIANNEVAMAIAGLIVFLTPFVLIFFIYVKSVFLNKIGIFLGGIGNTEGAFKILCYAIASSAFSPIFVVVAAIYAIIICFIGVRYVYSIDYLGVFITLFFSALFAALSCFLASLPFAAIGTGLVIGWIG